MATTFMEAPEKAADDSQSRLVDYYRRMGDFLDELYEEATGRQKQIPEIKQMEQTIDYLAGLQWRDKVPSYRPKPLSNEALDNFWETIGMLTDIKPMFHIKEIGLDGTYSETAKVLNGCGKGWAKQNHFSRTLGFWTMFAMMTTAPAIVYWNRFAHGDSEDTYDADITFKHLPPTALLRVGAGHDLQHDECVIYRHRETLAWIKRAYPKMGQLVRPQDGENAYDIGPQVPPTVMPQFYEMLAPQQRRLIGGSEKSLRQSKYPDAEVREYWLKDDMRNESGKEIWVGPENSPFGYWVKPGQKVYPRGRLVIRANRVTLYDEPNPYFHRKRPFVQMGLYSVPWQQYALSVIKPWIDSNDIINQIMAGLLLATKRALNPALMAPKSAIHPDALKQIDAGKPNLKVSYNSNAVTPPAWQQPPNIGSYPMPVLQMIKQDMRRSSGSSAMDAALSKKQVPGGDTLDRIQFSKTTPIRQMGGNVEDGVDDVGMLWTGTALQFYGAEKRIEMLGLAGLTKADIDDKPGSLIPDGMNSEGFVRRFHFECERGSLLNIDRKDKVQVGFALRKNRDLSRKQLFNMLDWNINQAENDAELAQEAQQMAQAMAAAGVQPGHHK